ncbi:hypothetical protein VTK73DRAFT_7209 [Phialemonium thermophilum]|uniref:Uncharacterized protein n=1 Tax=Phialemonium thermophilum TaxID=223376 RepID=A0ABR3WFX3_9PEZI
MAGNWSAEVERTVYTTTDTIYSHVDCQGCALTVTTTKASAYGGPGPEEIVTGTTTATVPFKTTLTVCSAEVSAPPNQHIPRYAHVAEDVRPALKEPRVHRRQETGYGAEPGATECTHTKVVTTTPLDINEGILTVYTTSSTLTKHIVCDGCNRLHVSSANDSSPAAETFYTAVTTAETPVSVTEYVCIKTPSIVTPRSLPARPTETGPGPTPTVLITVTTTVYNATATVVKTATCQSIDSAGSAGPPGAIPKRRELAGGSGSIGLPAVTGNGTVYSTITSTTSATWTQTQLQCSSQFVTPTATSTTAIGPPLRTGPAPGLLRPTTADSVPPPPSPPPLPPPGEGDTGQDGNAVASAGDNGPVSSGNAPPSWGWPLWLPWWWPWWPRPPVTATTHPPPGPTKLITPTQSTIFLTDF